MKDLAVVMAEYIGRTVEDESVGLTLDGIGEITYVHSGETPVVLIIAKADPAEPTAKMCYVVEVHTVKMGSS